MDKTTLAYATPSRCDIASMPYSPHPKEQRGEWGKRERGKGRTGERSGQGGWVGKKGSVGGMERNSREGLGRDRTGRR